MKLIIFDFYRTLYDPGKHTFTNGALKTIKKLQGRVKMALITTEDGQRSELINNTELGEFLEKIIFTKEKSEKDFMECCKFFNVSPLETIVIGDRVRGEIKIGNKLGMYTIQFRNGLYSQELPRVKNEQPNTIISQFRDLEKILDSKLIEDVPY